MKSPLLIAIPAALHGILIAPIPYPVFLKAGFSSVLEFDETPRRVVLGDAQSFQVEKLDHSLVVKTLAPYAASNMFVYFEVQSPRLFVLTASEDAEPTYYRKFENPPQLLPKPETPEPKPTRGARLQPGARLTLVRFDHKKDYLTLEVQITADSKAVIKPNWSLIRLRSSTHVIVPYKLWAERQEVQKDSRVIGRFIFVRPNVDQGLKNAFLIIPLHGSAHSISLPLRKGDTP